MKIVSYLLHNSGGECWVWGRALKVLCQPYVKALNNLVWRTFLEILAIGTLFCVICKISFETSILNQCKHNSFSGDTFKQRALVIDMHKTIALT